MFCVLGIGFVSWSIITSPSYSLALKIIGIVLIILAFVILAIAKGYKSRSDYLKSTERGEYITLVGVAPRKGNIAHRVFSWFKGGRQ